MIARSFIITQSLIPMNTPKNITETITTTVESKSSGRVGHEHFFSSVLTPSKKAPVPWKTSTTFLILKPQLMVRKTLSTTQMAGQEGIEPPTFGFGDRRSAKLSY